jgi:hypothetical protein
MVYHFNLMTTLIIFLSSSMSEDIQPACYFSTLKFNNECSHNIMKTPLVNPHIVLIPLKISTHTMQSSAHERKKKIKHQSHKAHYKVS